MGLAAVFICTILATGADKIERPFLVKGELSQEATDNEYYLVDFTSGLRHYKLTTKIEQPTLVHKSECFRSWFGVHLKQEMDKDD